MPGIDVSLSAVGHRVRCTRTVMREFMAEFAEATMHFVALTSE